MKNSLLIIIMLFLFNAAKASDIDHHKIEKSAHEENNHSHENNESEHDDHGEDSDHAETQSKTILEVKDNGNKFKLSEPAIKTLKINFSPCKFLGNKKIEIPKTAMVNFRKEFALYFYESNWFELVEVKIDSRTKTKYVVSSSHFSDLKNSCQIVTSGVSLLRVAQLEALGEGGQGHAH